MFVSQDDSNSVNLDNVVDIRKVGKSLNFRHVSGAVTTWNYASEELRDEDYDLIRDSGSSAGSGTVTFVQVEDANGFTGLVATASTTPMITIGTSLIGLLKGDGEGLLVAVEDIDYQIPITVTTVDGETSLVGGILNIAPSAGSAYTGEDGITIVGSVIGLGDLTPHSIIAESSITASNLSGTNTGDQTNISGNSATVTTNANLIGVITSSGNTTAIASQTGTGSKFVVDNSPVLITPNLGTPSTLIGTNISGSATNLTSGKSNALNSSTTSVDVSGATAPIAGQILTATTASTAIWQEPAGITGLTTNFLPKAASSTTIINSLLYDDGTNIGLGIASSLEAKVHLVTNSLGATPTIASGVYLQNTTSAGVGAQQVSPTFTLEGQGWKTNATAASQSVKFRLHTLPVQGTSAPTSFLMFQSSINNGAFTSPMVLSSLGALTTTNSLSIFGAFNGATTISGSDNLVISSGTAHSITTTATVTTGFTINASSLTTGTGFSLNSTSTAAASNTQTLMKVLLSGTNATTTQTTTAAIISNTHAGTLSTNVGLRLTASGGTSANYALITTAGNVGIGISTPDTTALVDLTSTTQGFLPPRMTTTQRTAITLPALGLIVFDITLFKLYCYDGTIWQAAW